jgi:GNAT superfamily N-acetyltransferase
VNIEIREAMLPGDVGELFGAVPELRALSGAEVVSRVGSEYLLVVAVCDGEIVGFKLGYPLSATCFYSWIGGVSPKVRRLGVGRRLLRHQEELVRGRGFGLLRVKSMNRFPSMLALMIAEGYAITAVEGEDPATLKIVFEKRL